jgi:DNA-binding GntR family transcriptional regulator
MNDLVTTPLRVITLKDRIVDAVRQAIASGNLNPGDRLVELKLAKRLGVGTTAVREALFQLEHLGFVTRVANRGTFVTEITREDAQQIFVVRRALECLAVELLAEWITPADISNLQGYVDRMKAAVDAGALADFYQNDIDFHRALWQLSGNRYLVSSLETLVVPLFAFFIMRTRTDSRDEMFRSVERHQEVLNAIKSGDFPRQHMESSMKEFQSFWEREERRSQTSR